MHCNESPKGLFKPDELLTPHSQRGRQTDGHGYRESDIQTESDRWRESLREGEREKERERKKEEEKSKRERARESDRERPLPSTNCQRLMY